MPAECSTSESDNVLAEGATQDEDCSGRAILDDVHSAIGRYCQLPSAEALDAVTLWVVHTHVSDVFDFAPRLVVRSPEKRSGKTRLLEILAELAHSPLRTVNASVPYIFRSLNEPGGRTLFIDEADALFGTRNKADQHESLRGLLNAGFQRGLTYGRMSTEMLPEEFDAFAPAVVAGIGRMPDTIEDRSVIIRMRRRKDSEAVAPFRIRRDRPALEVMKDRIALWAVDAATRLMDAQPDMPVEDRAADVWEPLVAVADEAGSDWPSRARKAALALTAQAEVDDVEANKTRILADIRAVFEGNPTTYFFKADDLCAALMRLDESPWADRSLSPSKLGQQLKPYGIRTSHNADKSGRGYRIVDFRDAFERYIPVLTPEA
ncbi:DUF3631 domain-containing protein [Rhodococcus sp. 05-339-2]|nr:DUF3631 domain-containing protein [Rhodococcus sp. 05-339-2]